MRGICKLAVLLGLVGLGMQGTPAQDVAETAAMTSHSTIAAQSAKAPSLRTPNSLDQGQSTSNTSMAAHNATAPSGTTASRATQTPSAFLVARTGPPPEEVNRKDFEDNAGAKAGKLLLRSVPSGAEIFINDLLVGRTPLLMVIAPGKYTIDMRGPRQESGRSTVGIMPKETQTVLIKLNERYPARVLAR